MALSGWIKLHRAIADHHVASDPASLSVWIYLLIHANHAETKRQINGRVITLSAGQLITSRKSISEKTGVQESKVERVLKMLKSEQQIEQRGSSKFRVISIVKWAEYQSQEHHNEQQMNNTRTTDEQQMNTPGEVLPIGNTKECKEGQENNIGATGKRSRSSSITAEYLAELGVDKQHAKDWMTARKSPLTKTALDAVVSEAAKAGVTLAEAVKTSAEQGWRGFKAVWYQNLSAGVKQNAKKSIHHGFEHIDYSAGLVRREDGTHGL